MKSLGLMVCAIVSVLDTGDWPTIRWASRFSKARWDEWRRGYCDTQYLLNILGLLPKQPRAGTCQLETTTVFTGEP